MPPVMSPSFIDQKVHPKISYAEREVFEALYDQLPDDWFVLHSLWLKNHPTKVHAEVDFVVIGKNACILLEVKGGNISRDQEGWHFSNRSGSQTRTSHEGPFDQVRSAYYSVQNFFRSQNKIHLFYNIVWGYAVITPQCIPRIRGTDPSFDQKLLLDLSRFPLELFSFLNEVARYWKKRCLEQKKNLRKSPDSLTTKLSPSLRKEIFCMLRPSFEPVRGMGVQAKMAKKYIDSLTEEQFRALDYAERNDRLVITGSAGTGKTILALEQARRLSQRDPNQKILFLCFNRLLSDKLALQIQEEKLQNIDVMNYHQCIHHLLKRAKMTHRIPEDWREFNAQVEDLLLEALDQIDFEPWDYLIVDEAQDLMDENFVGALDLILKGGLERGRWTLCLDIDQAIFQDHFDQKICDQICSYGVSIHLPENCRNTFPVSVYIKELAGVGARASHRETDPQVRIKYYADFRDYLKLLKKEVNQIITQFEPASIPPSEIIILSAQNKYLSSDILKPGFFLRPLEKMRNQKNENSVLYSTIQAFKGLEKMAVILIGCENLASKEEKLLLYVGASRACSILHILLPDSCCEYIRHYQVRLVEALSHKGG